MMRVCSSLSSTCCRLLLSVFPSLSASGTLRHIGLSMNFKLQDMRCEHLGERAEPEGTDPARMRRTSLCAHVGKDSCRAVPRTQRFIRSPVVVGPKVGRVHARRARVQHLAPATQPRALLERSCERPGRAVGEAAVDGHVDARMGRAASGTVVRREQLRPVSRRRDRAQPQRRAQRCVRACELDKLRCAGRGHEKVLHNELARDGGGRRGV
mmetsp:Transcript_13172/g.34322  ORF Transcript_13172/g.34322 Transcript_13172/m.34322 type:complete len:211 (-) Transcript_13172:1061-1693(-)